MRSTESPVSVASNRGESTTPENLQEIVEPEEEEKKESPSVSSSYSKRLQVYMCTMSLINFDVSKRTTQCNLFSFRDGKVLM